MKKIIKHTDEIKGLNVEICNWDLDMGNGEVNNIWNTYIYVFERNITPEVFKKLNLRAKKNTLIPSRIFFDYYKLDEYFNFSGGITFYEKVFDQKGKVKGFKIGNDYNHIWNGGETFKSVKNDLEASINTFINQTKTG